MGGENNMKREKKVKKLIALILCGILLVSLLYGCGATTPPQTTTGEKTAVVYVADIFNTLNPYDTGAFSDSYVFNQVFETIAAVDDEGNAQPYLAESWTISDDALTYNIKLVEDATFSNGEPVKASDVVYSYTYAKEFAAKNAFYSMVDTVKTIDDYTVEFKLTKPSPLFLTYSQQIPIISERFAKEGGDISKEAIGSGPYTIVNYDPAVKVVFTAPLHSRYCYEYEGASF